MLNLQLTIFILLAAGFLVKRVKLVGSEGQKNITDLVIYLVLPCNIVTSFLNGTTVETLQDCLWVFLISTVTQGFCAVYGKILFRKYRDDHRRCLHYGTICSNAGFLGNPIAEGAYGSLGLMYASVYLIPQRIMMWSEGIAIFSGEGNWKAIAKKIAVHPCILACELGILLMLTGISPPAIILSPLQIIGRCNTALSMLVIGMILESVDLKTMVDKTVLHYTLQRLVIIPMLVYLFCLALNVGETVRGVCVLLAAMPAGATTSMLAAKYNMDPEFATKLVVFSTLCSIPAILIWCAIL